MAQWKQHRNLRFLRVLLFQDQTCTMRLLFAPLPIPLEQKGTKETKSKRAARGRIYRHKAQKLSMATRMACGPRSQARPPKTTGVLANFRIFRPPAFLGSLFNS